jgi:pSer/pThr/pTyr-binding forkhead associated (FHA) protein
MVFGEIATTGSTSLMQGMVESPMAALEGIAGNTPTSDTGGRLVRVADGTATEIPIDGVVIGRDPGCDIVLRDKGASRRHATVRPSLQGYVITDQSVNGLTVNGRRLDGMQVLGMGDLVRIGDDEFRFEADTASFEPDPALLARDTGEVNTTRADPGSDAPPSIAPPAAALPPTVEKPRAEDARLLATLEILNQGVHHGTRFRIERPVSQVGRGRQSDIRLDDDSVSGAHATLMRRSVGWVVIDLDSTNGTYVDGNRILGEHALPGACELRFGGIKTLFRPIAGSAPDSSSTRAIVGVPDGPPRR